MHTDEGLLRFTAVTEPAHRGRAIEGTFVADAAREVRSLRVELVRTQTSASTPASEVDVVAQQEVAGPTRLDGGERFTFSIDVPEDATPGFETPHGSLTWSVRARADVLGGDPTVVAEVTIAPLAPDVRATGLLPDTTVAAIAAATIGRTQFAKRNALGVGLVFLAGGVLFTVIGLTRSGGDHPGAARFVSFAFAAVLLALGASLVVQRLRRGGGVTASTDASVYRPGDTVTVTAYNPTRAPLTIGLQEVEVRARVQGSGKNARHDAPQHELAAEWRDLPPGDHRLAFTIRPDAIGSFGGRTIAVAHRVAVFPHGKQVGSGRTLHEHHIVVVR